MVVASIGEVVQLTVGSIMGAAVTINMMKHGMSPLDPKTRWQSLALIGSFLFCFLAVSDAILNSDLLVFN